MPLHRQQAGSVRHGSAGPRDWLMHSVLLAIFVVLCVGSLLLGAHGVGLDIVFVPSPENLLILTASRLPRLITVVLVGVGLAVSGVILQQTLRNRFAEPATTGGLEAAKLGVLVALTLLPSVGPLLRMGFAMLFCLAANLVFVALLQRIRFRDTTLVPVVGLMFGATIGALAEFYAYSQNIMQSMQGWMLGDVSRIVQGHYELIYVLVPIIVVTYMFASRFTLLAMGQDIAESLGVSYRMILLLGLTLVSATVAASVITVGAIPFVGLVVPNIVTLWQGDNLRRTLPTVALLGAILLLICDILGRLLIYPYEVPIGLTVAGVGGVAFLILVLRGRA